MHDPIASHKRGTNWAVIGLQAGVLLFAGGITLLYLNPYWHVDETGFLDQRVHWWNGTCAILAGAGLFIEALALLSSLAVVVSRLLGRRLWPYAAAALLVACVLVWVGPEDFTRNLDAHFEWNSADGFTVFRLQAWNEAANTWRPVESNALQSIVKFEIQPWMHGYFKLNDWQRMNGDVGVKVTKIIPMAWPVALGSGGETLEDPDQTPLMRAAVQGDLKTIHDLLSTPTTSGVNDLDQGGQSALILACQNPKANPEVVKTLIAAGANVNLRSRNGYTALTWSLSRNNNDVIRLLRRAGARP
ncbi:MAG: ankyrin repeat domain-containing protein [Candidatus Sulfotelmatobacter sp.]